MADAIVSRSCKLGVSLPWEAEFAQDEDKEDSAILQDWLQHRSADAEETVSLDDLERELLPVE